MAEHELIEIARETIAAFNAADWERLGASIAPDVVYDELGTQRRTEGWELYREAMQDWKRAFPDATGTITNAFASDNSVTLEITWEGTHTGPLEGPAGTIPASGKRQVTDAAMVFSFDGEKVAECRHYFDSMTLMQQIGAAPTP